MTKKEDIKKKRFIELIREYEKVIISISSSFAKDESDAKDIRQEILIILWKNYSKSRIDFKNPALIYRIAVNAAINLSKKERIRTQLIQEIEKENDKRSELIEYLQEILKLLTEPDRSIMELKLKGYKTREIAKILHISKEKIDTRVLRLKEKIKKIYESESR